MISYPPSGQTWQAVVTKIHDGDTVTLDVALGKSVRGKDQTLGFHVYIEGRSLHFHNATRLFGINAPELATPAGKTAQAALAQRIPIGSPVTVTTWLDQADKYGRVLARLDAGGDINQWLIDGGWAAEWYGAGPKPVP